MEKIFLCIRRTKEYFNGKFCFDFPKKWKSSFDTNLLMWKLFFKMDYMEFRVRLAKIASLSYNINSFDGFFEWMNWEEIEKHNNVWILPIDDDDWLHPNILTYLRSLDISKKKFVRWNVVSVDSFGKAKSFTDTDTFGFLRTRSCSFMTRWPSSDREFIDGHTALDRHLRRNKGHLLEVKRCLSVKLGHWASISSFVENSPDSLLSIIRQKVLLDKHELLKDYHPLIDLYNELFTDVYNSFKIK